MTSDDSFGPVQRGGPGSGTDAATPPREPGTPPPPAGHGPEDEGFGPAISGRSRRFARSPGERQAPARQPRGRPAGGRRTPPPAPKPAPPRHDQPPPRGPGRADDRATPRRRRRRPLKVLLTALLVLLVVLVGSAAALAVYASSRVERVPVAGLSSAPGMNVLVVGSDSRAGLSDEDVRDLGTGRVAGRRADTIFVLSTRGGDSAILSFPRDLFVTRCDGSQGRINAAFAMGTGPDCLVQTVSATSGLSITGYLEVNFRSFVSIVDAVGGVEVCTDEPIRDASAAIDLPAGCHELDGAGALGFVRVRKIDDDLGRIGRQQYFIQQLAREVAEPSTFLNLPRLWSTAGAAGGALIADEEFGTLDMLRLALAARGMAAGGTPTHVVPGTPQTVGGAAVLVPVEGEAEALYASFRDGSVLRQQPEPDSE